MSNNGKSNQMDQSARQNAFSVYDEKAQAYNLPFFFPQIGVAIRAFTSMVQDQNSIIFRNPEDFTLYHIGTYSDLNGRMEAFSEPRFIARATDVMQKPNQPIEVKHADS